MPEFKYPLGTKLRRGLMEVRITGYLIHENGTRSYAVVVWGIQWDGYKDLIWDAFTVENDDELKEVK